MNSVIYVLLFLLAFIVFGITSVLAFLTAEPFIFGGAACASGGVMAYCRQKLMALWNELFNMTFWEYSN